MTGIFWRGYNTTTGKPRALRRLLGRIIVFGDPCDIFGRNVVNIGWFLFGCSIGDFTQSPPFGFDIPNAGFGHPGIG